MNGSLDETGLDPLFAPRGVAVIGASKDPSKLGSVMRRSLQGFEGPVVGVNPRDPDPETGLFASVADAVAYGHTIDLAVLCVPAAATASAVREAAAGGASAALICAGGFAEAGDAGAAYQQSVLEALKDTGTRALGPNTSGFLVPSRALTASFVPAASMVGPGSVAVVAASGGVNHALSFLLADAGFGVSLAVGLGNAIDVDSADVLRYLLTDESTKAVALHVESVQDGPALCAAVAALTARVPVVALVVGREDVSDFAQSHTGALATSWRVTRAALRQSGAVLVDDERELVEAVTALSLTRLAPSLHTGVGVVTAQAGPGLLHIDGLTGRGVKTPELTADTRAALAQLLPPLTFQRNPVDTGRPGATFGEILAVTANDPAVGLLSVYALTEPDALDLSAAVAAANVSTPIVIGLGGPHEQVRPVRDALRNRGIPAATSPSALTEAVAALVEDGARRARPSVTDDDSAALPAEVSARLGGAALDEDQCKQILDLLGIATPPRRACDSRQAAQAALAELTAPIAVKLLDAEVIHKSDIGGVVLGVRSEADLESALDQVEKAGARRFLLESMASQGVDLVVGATRDPVFGPTVVLGIGGTTAEALDDVVVRVAPLPIGEAAQMPGELAAHALLEGWRGLPAADPTALAQVVVALGRVLVAHPNVSSIEINPLRITANGLVALDAVITF